MSQVITRKLQVDQGRLQKQQELSEKKAIAQEAQHKTRVRLIQVLLCNVQWTHSTVLDSTSEHTVK